MLAYTYQLQVCIQTYNGNHKINLQDKGPPDRKWTKCIIVQSRENWVNPFHICCDEFSNKEMRVLEKGVCPRVIMTIIIIVLLDLHSVGLSSAIPNERDHPN